MRGTHCVGPTRQLHRGGFTVETVRAARRVRRTQCVLSRRALDDCWTETSSGEGSGAVSVFATGNYELLMAVQYALAGFCGEPDLYLSSRTRCVAPTILRAVPTVLHGVLRGRVGNRTSKHKLMWV